MTGEIIITVAKPQVVIITVRSAKHSVNTSPKRKKEDWPYTCFMASESRRLNFFNAKEKGWGLLRYKTENNSIKCTNVT